MDVLKTSVLLLGCPLIFLTSATLKGEELNDDWLGVPSRTGVFAISYGVYETDSRTVSLNATFPFVNYSEMYLYYADFQSSDFGLPSESQDFGLFWQSDPADSFVMGFGYDVGGRSSELASKDYSLMFEWALNQQWRVGSTFVKGESSLEFEGFSPVYQREFQSLGLGEVDRRGIGTHFRFENDEYMWRFSYRYFDYDDEGTSSSANIDEFTQALREESLESARFAVELDLYIRYQALIENGYSEAHAQSLTYLYYLSRRDQINQEIDQWANDYVGFHLGVGHKNILSTKEIAIDFVRNFPLWSWGAGFFTYESYVDKELETQLYSSINYSLGNHSNLGVLVSYFEGSHEFYGEFSIGVVW